MLRKIFFYLLLMVCLASFSPDLLFAEATVVDAAIATGVEELVPVGEAFVFESDVSRLYCFTRIVGGEPGVKHIWYYGDRVMGEVDLLVKSPNYRTYSSKDILPAWVGDWHVDIVSGKGKVIETLSFKIR